MKKPHAKVGMGTAKSPGVGAIITIAAGMMAMVAIIGMVVSFTGIIETTYMQLAFETPKFDYVIEAGLEQGNEMLEVYKMMRLVGAGIFVLVLIFASVNRVLESADLGIVQRGTANKMMSKSLLFLIVMVVFPPMWDMAADGMTNISYWVLNPYYSFDQEHTILDNNGDAVDVTLQCPYDWGVDPGGQFNMVEYENRVLDAYQQSPYIPGYARAIWGSGGFQELRDETDTQRPSAVTESLHNGNTLRLGFDERVAVSADDFDNIEVFSNRAITDVTVHYDKVFVKFAGPPVSENSVVTFDIPGHMTGLETLGIAGEDGMVTILSAEITGWGTVTDPDDNRNTMVMLIDRVEAISEEQIESIVIDGESDTRDIIEVEQFLQDGINEITITFSGPSADDSTGATIHFGTGDRQVTVRPLAGDKFPLTQLNLDAAQIYGGNAFIADFDGPVDTGVSPADFGGVVSVVENRNVINISGNFTETIFLEFSGADVDTGGVQNMRVSVDVLDSGMDVNQNPINPSTRTVNILPPDPDAPTEPIPILAAVIEYNKIKVIWSMPVRITGPISDSFGTVEIIRGGDVLGSPRDVLEISGNGSDTTIVTFDANTPVFDLDRGRSSNNEAANGGDTALISVGGPGISGVRNGVTMTNQYNLTAQATNFMFDHGAANIDEPGTEDLEFVCSPQLRVSYVFGQMLRDTTDTETQPPIGLDEEVRANLVGTDIKDAQNWTSELFGNIQSGASDFMMNLFLGLTKALVALQILIMTLMIGIMADMLAAMIAAGLPVFMMLSLIPKIEDTANKMMNALPALLILPLMSAIIIVVGSAAVIEAGGEDSVNGHIYTWITSIGVVFFAVTLPVILVPLLGNVSQMATQMVSSAVSTGAMVTGMAASSAATGFKDFGRFSKMPGTGIGDGSEFQQHGGYMGQMKAGLGGLMKGLTGAHSMVGMPSVGGFGGDMVNPKQMESAITRGQEIGHGGLPQYGTKEEQMNVVETRADQVQREGYTERNLDSLANTMKQNGVVGAENVRWNPHETRQENYDRIDEYMGKLEANAGRNPLSDEVKEGMFKVRGEMHEVIQAQKEGTLTPEKMEHLMERMNEGDKFNNEVSPGYKVEYLKGEIEKRAATS